MPPSFAETPAVFNGTTGVAQTWTLPNVTAGWGDVKNVTLSDSSSYSNIITLSGNGTSYSLVYNGGYGTITSTQNLTLEIILENTVPLTTTVEISIVITYVAPPPVTCTLSSSRVASVTSLLATESVKLELQEATVASANALYGATIDKVTQQLALTASEKLLCNDGKLTVALVSKYSFLSLVTSTQAVFLNGDDKTTAGEYDDAYIELKLATAATWRLPIKVTFTTCTITSLSFSKKRLSFTYDIGSGESRVILPTISQEPDCGQTFNKLSIRNTLS